jgi:hypothetical protein
MKQILPENFSVELRLMVEALNEVDEIYYKEKLTKRIDGKIIDTGETRTNERAFVAQLLSKVENKYKEHSIHIDKFYQADAPKSLIYKNDLAYKKYNETFNELFELEFEEEFYKVPDIVIHAGPEDDIPQNQIFLAEVKTTVKLAPKLFNVDLFKVNVYHEELNFRNSAFIIVNLSLETVAEFLAQYSKKSARRYKSFKPGLVIVVKSSYKEPAAVFNQFFKYDSNVSF